jgi:hypothetical protein
MSHTSRTLLRIRTRCVAGVTAALAAALTAASPAAAGWAEPVPGPIYDSVGPSRSPDMTVIDGVPYVAWTQWDGANKELRVARLSADGTAWEEVVGGASPINHSPSEDAEGPSITSIGSVPYVAWDERSGANEIVRVSRLNDADDDWEEIGGPASDTAATTWGSRTPWITAANGVPYVAWRADNTHLEVTRLNDAGTGWTEVPTPALPALNIRMGAVGGVPYVASRDTSLRVARLNAAGTAFEDAGSPAGLTSTSLADVGGVAYFASTQWNGTTDELRVSRRNAADTGWEQVGGVLNHASDQQALDPSVADVGGVPYVAWGEVVGNDSAHVQLRVSRLNAAGTAWEEVVGGDSLLGVPLDHRAEHPSLVGIGGVPYVAWQETGPGYTDVHVSRLEPEFLAQGAIATDHEALLLALVRTHGVPYPIAFEYGANGGLGERTAVTRTAPDRGEDTVIQKLAGLAPETAFAWRPIGFDGLRATGAGRTGSFTTLPTPKPPARLLLAIVPERIESVAGRRVTVRYLSTRSTRVTLEVRRHGHVLVEVGGKAHVGRNKIGWNGRLGAGSIPASGRYTLVLKARTLDGQTAIDRVPLRLVPRAR